MTDIHIDVRGLASATAPPELGVVHAAISADGPEPGPVSDRVNRRLKAVRAGLEVLQESGVVENVTVDQIRVSAQRPWNEQGLQLPLVHTATVNLTATFCRFEELGEWVLTEGLNVHYVDWQLRPQTRAALERDTRQAALRDAVVRAQDYADTLELGPVRVRTVRDQGVAPEPRMMMAAATMDAGPAVEFSPEDIEVDAEVHASFTVTA